MSSRTGSTSMSRGLRASLLGFTVLVLVVVYTPLALVVINSFNVDRTFTWPPPDLTLHWWDAAWHSKGARSALWTSVEVALAATAISLVLGTLALPGIVTGVALSNAFTTILGIELSLFTVVVAHATFCIVTVFNNVQARLQRLGGNMEQASMDLGAGPFTTFRLVTFPMMRSALLAGALLSFGLSFDEIVVTTFTISATDQTLPIWIFQNLFRPNQAPVVNVVAALLVLLSAIPIYLAQRLSSGVAQSAAAAP